MGSLGFFFWNRQRCRQDFLQELVERRQQFQPLQDHLRDWGSAANASVKAKLPEPAFAPNFAKDEALVYQIQALKNPRSRKKVIRGLARGGDSRAIQPLVELMAESDAQERSLILEALFQISSRALKPMNQALALSLQDLNPQVRKNAVRDLSRLYEVLSQMSQLLTDATYDQDEEVKAIAKSALSQFHNSRSLG